MRIAFCDDNVSERKLLTEYALRYAAEHNINVEPCEYMDAGSLLDDPQLEQTAAIFFDIYMDGVSGVTAARLLRERGFAGAIVFVTESRDHFADGFAVDASHYLLKPADYPRFAEAMERVLRITGVRGRTLTVLSGQENILVPAAAIEYIEVISRKTLIYLRNKTAVKVSHTLSELEEMLGGAPFIRCFRSYIVNMDYVEQLNDNDFLMKNGARILIARDKHREVKSAYLSYVCNSLWKAAWPLRDNQL